MLFGGNVNFKVQVLAISLISFFTSISSGQGAGGAVPNCNPVFNNAVATCNKINATKDTICADLTNDSGDFSGTRAHKKKKVDSDACAAKIAAEFKKCETDGYRAVEKCEMDRQEALKIADQGAKDREAGEKKLKDADDKANLARVKTEQAAANNQSSAEAIQLQQQAESLRKQGSNERSDGNNRMVAGDDAALVNGDMAASLAALIETRRKEATDIQKAAAASGDMAKSLLDQTGGSNAPDSATDGAAKKPSKQSGSPGGNQGQGGSSGDQANNNQQKKQDEAGGGGGGMPSMGGGSGSGSSSPLTVNEAKQDCSNPSFAASNPVCTCRLNATDSRCAGILAAEKNSQTAKKAANMYSDDSTGGGGGFSTAGGGYKTPEEKNISQHGQLAQGAGGSVGKGVGSGVGSKEANDPRQAQARSYRDQYTTGKRGGGSYGSGGGGSFAAGQAGQPNSKIPSTFARANVGKNQPQGKLSAADLRAQMQARFAAQRRGPSSTTGRADITGPHTDQFKKIRVRYAELMGL